MVIIMTFLQIHNNKIDFQTKFETLLLDRDFDHGFLNV